MSPSSSSSSGGPYFEWKAWPGGQSDQNLNPTEKFESTDFGFEGNVDWDVGQGAVHVEAKIIKTDGTPVDPPVTTASNCSSITVRYETRSPTAAEVDTAWIQATKNAVTKTKKRTVFEANWTKLNFSDPYDDANDLREPETKGKTTNEAAFNWPGQEDDDGATRVAGKMEATLTTAPDGIDWAARGVTWTFSKDGGSGKSHARLHRKGLRTAVKQDAGPGKERVIVTELNDEDDENWPYDGDSEPEDAQNPSATLSKGFRIDSPGFDREKFKRIAVRSDFQEIAEWHNGDGWQTITPSTNADWFFNGTEIPDPEDPNAHGIYGGDNNHGAGHNATRIPNGRPEAVAEASATTVQGGERVWLWSSGSSDPDEDQLVYFEWTQTEGPTVELMGGPHAESPFFSAPEGNHTLKFSLKVGDITKNLLAHKPDPENWESTNEATVTVTVEESASSSSG